MLPSLLGSNDGNSLKRDIRGSPAVTRPLAKPTNVNRFRSQPFAAAYLAVWMNLMTPLPYPRWTKFRLTML